MNHGGTEKMVWTTTMVVIQLRSRGQGLRVKCKVCVRTSTLDFLTEFFVQGATTLRTANNTSRMKFLSIDVSLIETLDFFPPCSP